MKDSLYADQLIESSLTAGKDRQIFMNIKERNALLIESVKLTEEEIREAILEGKRKKYFHNKHKDYWKCTASVVSDQKTKTPASVPAAEENDAKQRQ